MTNILFFGALIGAIIGIFHGYYVYRLKTCDSHYLLVEHPLLARMNAAYYALWTFILWVLFGTYVLLLWLLAVIIFIPMIIVTWITQLFLSR